VPREDNARPQRERTILKRLAVLGNNLPAARFLDTGLRALDEALGGGFPRGRMVEFFGPAGSGKTTLALQCIAHLQRAGLNAAFIDADQTFDATYAYSLGVDAERLPLVQPNSAEQAMGIARTLAESGAVDLIVVDSAAALAPRLEVEAGITEAIPRLQTRVLSNELRKLGIALRRGDSCALFLNQMRSRPDRGPGEAETSAGGPPLKLFAAVRIAMLPAGSKLRLRVLKNNAAAGVRGRELEWRRGSGFLSATDAQGP
jgi:recombination protein RecA